MAAEKNGKSDIEIASNSSMKSIADVASSIGIQGEELELYGTYKAKLSDALLKRLGTAQDGKLILVTSINPTPAGEGKSTVTVGLGQALNRIGKKAVIAMREPSLGPVMGLKGGAAGGGYSQVLPMDDINLHFTGDLHAITSANNALSAFIDNHIHQGNELELDPGKIVWKRALDINDRALRNVVTGLGGASNGLAREDQFDITAASEIMAVLCMAENLQDLKQRLSNIVAGYTKNKQPVTVGDLGFEGALTLLLKDAVKPNLVQTIEHTPALIHGGPFANIAHGCNSLIATKAALKLGDYAVTEAGFGADLGAEKFLNIKARAGGLKPAAVVIVATIRALKMHGGIAKNDLRASNPEALIKGCENLQKHIETIRAFGLPYAVAVNRFTADSDKEIHALQSWCGDHGHPCALTEVWEKGGEGGVELAEIVTRLADRDSDFSPLYQLEVPFKEKARVIAEKVYGADEVLLTSKAEKQLADIEANGWGDLPLCMAKTQYSLSDDPKKLGRPDRFSITIREIKPSAGAGFLVALTGEIMTMPGLPKKPAALNMDVDADGRAKGLF
ncbi:formate--tetrahydrofolate ligase [Metabacillus sp. KIGAM252]|uniref:Formate--tetrahydrofolate ligase n=1 Tax=Metabacillus flavus TaxID=2823519 RepID=A0ABS5LF08_9BACI|nr:formate--tetrahydrofolate ligase [Metabacillus flavus]MBS2969327.1 formate--tetrahydrofolate ligase [Metabacillus flavus]